MGDRIRRTFHPAANRAPCSAGSTRAHQCQADVTQCPPPTAKYAGISGPFEQLTRTDRLAHRPRLWSRAPGADPRPQARAPRRWTGPVYSRTPGKLSCKFGRRQGTRMASRGLSGIASSSLRRGAESRAERDRFAAFVGITGFLRTYRRSGATAPAKGPGRPSREARPSRSLETIEGTCIPSVRNPAPTPRTSALRLRERGFDRGSPGSTNLDRKAGRGRFGNGRAARRRSQRAPAIGGRGR